MLALSWCSLLSTCGSSGVHDGHEAVAVRISGGNDMFKKRTPVQWVSFFIVLAMVVVLFWLAHYLEKASF